MIPPIGPKLSLKFGFEDNKGVVKKAIRGVKIDKYIYNSLVII